MRVPYPAGSWEIAGDRIAASRLSARAPDGRGSTVSELGDLLAAGCTLAGVGGKSEMPSGLPPN